MFVFCDEGIPGLFERGELLLFMGIVFLGGTVLLSFIGGIGAGPLEAWVICCAIFLLLFKER